jgi:hypothetical protein
VITGQQVRKNILKVVLDVLAGLSGTLKTRNTGLEQVGGAPVEKRVGHTGFHFSCMCCVEHESL